MSKKRANPRASRSGAQSRPVKPERRAEKGQVPPAPQESEGGWLFSPEAWREIVESVVIAFVLAFLFRTFEAEAFVIPTGSMASTLMGRHKDLVCAKCEYPYRVSASEEINPDTNRPSGKTVIACTCPMCHYTMEIGNGNPQGKKYTSYKGDRILVSKFPYQFRDPQRWEVAVFKYPGGAKTNFIKRIVGLPNETLQISHGDVFTKANGEEEFTIARKPPGKLRAILRLVYDNDYVLPELIELGWPARWRAWPPEKADQQGNWSTEDYMAFRTDGTADDVAWLRYQHVIPSCEDWQYLEAGLLPPEKGKPVPQLITDFAAYNSEIGTYYALGRSGRSYRFDNYSSFGAGPADDGKPKPIAKRMGLHWVDDLAVECEMKVEGPTGEAILELIEGGRRFLCHIDVASGQATLTIEGHEAFGRPRAKTKIQGPGTYKVMFSNVDDELRLWIDGRVVEFDAATTYVRARLNSLRPQKDDVEPVLIGSRGAGLEVSHLRVYRDIYYIAKEAVFGEIPDPIHDFDPNHFPYYPMSRDKVAEVQSDPYYWNAFAAARPAEFELDEGQFLALGDNSAESKDGRLWKGEGFEHYVSRELLIGKALFIYWPHSLDKIPYLGIPIRFFPNCKRMRFVK